MIKSTQDNLLWVFLLCVAVLTGSCYQLFVDSEVTRVTDGLDYFKMAQGDFDVIITRRYRAIIPFLAKLISMPLEYITEAIWSYRGGSYWALKFSFYIVNIGVFSLAGTFIFKLCRVYGATVLSSLVALLAVLVSRWTEVAISFPLTDSLYLLVVVFTLYGIKCEKKWPLIFSILIGPFAKESYIFIAPVILLFARHILPVGKQVALFLVSGILVFSFRYWIDASINEAPVKSLENAFDHFNHIIITAKRIASFKGIGEILSIWGLFTFILIAGFFGGKNERMKWAGKLDWTALFIVVSFLTVHPFLSTSVARMVFFASPVFAICIALILDRHKYFRKYREWLSIEEVNEGYKQEISDSKKVVV